MDAPKDAGKATYVGLTITAPTAIAALNERYYITLPTIIVPKNAAKGSVTITLTPRQTTEPEEDLPIPITSTLIATTTDRYTLAPADGVVVTLIDDDGQRSNWD